MHAGKDVGADDDDPWGIREQFKKETPALRPLENAQPIQVYSRTLKGNGQSQKDLFSVFEFARADIHYLTSKDILVFMGSKLTDLIQFDAGVFYVADLESSTVVAKHVVGRDAITLLNHTMSLEQKLSGWAAANNESLPNLPPDPDFAHWQGEKPSFQYSIVAPMNTSKVVLGAVTLYRRGNTKFTDEERRKLELVASQTGVALAKSGKASQENEMVDKLTSLPNGYQLYFMYDQVAIDASRFDYSIALLTVRLDDAKLRRRWGRAVGDDAVRNVANYLSKEIRETDLLVRYANDEFIILVPRVDLEKSEGLKSRFQDDLDHFRFQVRPGTYTSLPVSIGISMFPSDGASLDELITTAEWRMQEDAELRVAVKSGLRSVPPNA